MAILAKFEKQPADVQDYDISFVAWLAGLSDTAVSVVATVAAVPGFSGTDGGTTQPIPAAITLGIVKVWLAGGTDGASYKITTTVTTASTPARVKQVEIVVKVKET